MLFRSMSPRDVIFKKCKLSNDEKNEMDNFINNPENEAVLASIFKISKSVETSTNLWHKENVNAEFDKLGFRG